MHSSHDDFRVQMHPSAHLDKVQLAFLGNSNRSLNWKRLKGSFVLSYRENFKVVSLWEWCGAVLVDSATHSFFNEYLYGTHPDIIADYFIFDEQSYKLNYKLPWFAARDMYEAKDRCEAAIVKWLKLSLDERESSWLVEKMLENMDKIDIADDGQRAVMLFVVFRL